MVNGPAAGGVNSLLLDLTNGTNCTVTDVTVVLLGDTSNKITGAEIVEWVNLPPEPVPDEEYDSEEGDNYVDDNQNGKLDPDEEDNIDSTPDSTCTAILEDDKIDPGASVTVGVRFKKNLPPNAKLIVYFSYGRNGRHYNLAVPDSSSNIEGAKIAVGQAVKSTVHTIKNTLDEFVKRIALSSFLSVDRIEVFPPYDNSQVVFIDSFHAEIVFQPAVLINDVVDLGIRFAGTTDAGAVMTQQVLETVPYTCQFGLSDVSASPCNPFGTYELSLQAQYTPPTGVWQDFVFVNGTGSSVSDLQVSFAGESGALRTAVLNQPVNCPAPLIPSNGQATNTVQLVWPDTCLPPNAWVTVRVYSPNGPATPTGGYWTINGQPAGNLRLRKDAVLLRSGGQPAGVLHFFLNGESAGTRTTNGTGKERVLLSGLAANGIPNVALFAVWENGFGCPAVTILNAFNTPLCPSKGYFAVELVEQISYTGPEYQPNTDDGVLHFAYFNAQPGTYLYFNALYFPPGGPPAWMAQNILLKYHPDTVRLMLPFDLDPYDANPPYFLFPGVPLTYLITDVPLLASPPPGVTTSYPVRPGRVGIGSDDGGPDPTLPDPPNGPIPPAEQPEWLTTTVSESVYRADMPNIDLDDSRFRKGKPGVPDDYVGDLNGCAPASVTNSVSWLRKKHQAIDDSLDSAFSNNAGDSAALRNMMYEFSRLMKHRRDSGVKPDTFLKGKLEFFDRYRVPIRVKFQSISIDTNITSPDRRYGHVAICENPMPNAENIPVSVTLNWIEQEFNYGEDVELGLAWTRYDSAEHKWITHGHAVVLTDITFQNNNWQIKVRDDGKQDERGGLRSNRVSWARLETNPANALHNRIRLPQFDSRAWGRCYIRQARSESYDPTMTFIALAVGDLQVTPAACHDSPTGSIRLTPTGGVPPYTVHWSNGASGEQISQLPTGAYGYTVTDNAGNTVSGSIFLPAPPPLQASWMIISPACADDPSGKITLSPSGGTPPYMVQWTGGQTGFVLAGIPAGAYTAWTTDAAGCTRLDEIQVTAVDNTAPIINCPPDVTLQYCGPLSYVLPMASDNCAIATLELVSGLGSGAVFPIGVHTEVYQATDMAGNQALCQFTVTVGEDWSVAATLIPIACFGAANGSLAVSITGGQAPYGYMWSNGQSGAMIAGLAAGTYTVTITDFNGCTSARTYMLQEPPALALTPLNVVPETNSQGNGSVAILALGGTAPYVYAGQTFSDTLVLPNLSAGVYALTIVDANGCTASLTVAIDNIIGISVQEYISAFVVYPNPAVGQFRIEVRLHRSARQKLRLCDAGGRVVQEWPAVSGTQQVQEVRCHNLTPGAYWVELNLDGASVVRRVVVVP